MGSRIATLRQQVAFGHFELTGHAKDQMEQDGFTVADVKSAIYSGRIVAVQRHGRGTRKLVVAGRTASRRRLRLVCRLTETGRLRVITVFAE